MAVWLVAGQTATGEIPGGPAAAYGGGGRRASWPPGPGSALTGSVGPQVNPAGLRGPDVPDYSADKDVEQKLEPLLRVGLGELGGQRHHIRELVGGQR